MILVGATAVGFSIVRALFSLNLDQLTVHDWYFMPAACGMPMIFAWSSALVLARFRRPRPAFHRLFRQPGTMACVAGISLAATWCLPHLISRAFGYGYRLPVDALNLLYVPFAAGSGVLGAWSVLILSRTGRFERGWIDRAGIVMGLAWVAMLFLSLADIYCH